MILEEAIKHCEEKAEELKAKAEHFEFWGKLSQKAIDDCLECAKDHEQLASWLKELKALRHTVSSLKFIDNAPPAEINDKSLEIARKCIELGLKVGKEEGKLGRPQSGWIPVSERLPEERINPYTTDFDEVLCTTDWGDVQAFKFGTPIIHHKPHFWLGGAIMDEHILAWQYKPEPYQKGDMK